MTNKQIATVFVMISWFMLIESVLIGVPLFVFYSIICIGLSHAVLKNQNNGPGGRMRH